MRSAHSSRTRSICAESAECTVCYWFPIFFVSCITTPPQPTFQDFYTIQESVWYSFNPWPGLFSLCIYYCWLSTSFSVHMAYLRNFCYYKLYLHKADPLGWKHSFFSMIHIRNWSYLSLLPPHLCSDLFPLSSGTLTCLLYRNSQCEE